MPLPATRDELVKSGYRFENHSVCREHSCRAEIEWWTSPRGSKMPFDLMPTGTSPAVTHFRTCPAADSFRRDR